MCSFEVDISLFHSYVANQNGSYSIRLCNALVGGCTTQCLVLLTSAVAGPIAAAFPQTILSSRTTRAAQPALLQVHVSSPFPFNTSLDSKNQLLACFKACLSITNLVGLPLVFRALLEQSFLSERKHKLIPFALFASSIIVCISLFPLV